MHMLSLLRHSASMSLQLAEHATLAPRGCQPDWPMSSATLSTMRGMCIQVC